MFGVGALAFGLGAGIFLLISPAVEREAHMAVVRTGETKNLQNSMRHLCWIRSGVEELDEVIPTLDLERRLLVLREAVALGCLDQLKPEIRATYYIVDAEGSRNLEKAIGYERDAVKPALEALQDSSPELARRGALVTAALLRRLEDRELERAKTLAAQVPDGPERRLLEHRLGVVSSVVPPVEAPEVEEEPAEDDPRLVPELRMPDIVGATPPEQSEEEDEGGTDDLDKETALPEKEPTYEAPAPHGSAEPPEDSPMPVDRHVEPDEPESAAEEPSEAPTREDSDG